MTTSDYIALCATIVAGCALAATSWQAWLAYQHNRLSVRPFLVWHTSRTNDANSSNIRFSVRNLGVGPAIIRDVFFQKDGVRFLPNDSKAELVPSFVEFSLGKEIQHNLKSFGLPGKNSALPSQSEIVIADIEFPGMSPVEVNTAIEMAGKISFHITYESLYREGYKFTAT